MEGFALARGGPPPEPAPAWPGSPSESETLLEELDARTRRGELERGATEGVPAFRGEFWTARQRQAHRIHEVSYRACFKPQLPRFFIERLSRPGEVVYDPFLGRGTTAVEAALLGRTPFGNDVNPLSRAFAEPRVHSPALSEVERRLEEIPWDAFRTVEREDLLAFYHPDTLAEVEGLRGWLLGREREGELDQVDRWIRMVALNRLTGHSSGFFSVYTLPPNQAVSVERQRRINDRRGQTPPRRDVRLRIARKSRSLLGRGAPDVRRSLFLTGPADRTPRIRANSVALVVTSPPFLDVVHYAADNWLRWWFLGVDPEAVPITRLRNLEAWRAFIRSTLVELSRVLRPGGRIAFEVGEVRKGTVRLEETVIRAARGLALEPVAVLHHQQRFTKTANCWGVSNNRSGTNSQRIVVFRRI